MAGNTSCGCMATPLHQSHPLASAAQMANMARQKLTLLAFRGKQAGTGVTQALQVGLRNGINTKNNAYPISQLLKAIAQNNKHFSTVFSDWLIKYTSDFDRDGCQELHLNNRVSTAKILIRKIIYFLSF